MPSDIKGSMLNADPEVKARRLTWIQTQLAQGRTPKMIAHDLGISHRAMYHICRDHGITQPRVALTFERARGIGVLGGRMSCERLFDSLPPGAREKIAEQAITKRQTIAEVLSETVRQAYSDA